MIYDATQARAPSRLLEEMPRRRSQTPKAPKPPPPEELPARYRSKAAAREIEQFLEERKDERGKPLFLAKELAAAADMSESTFSHKMAGRNTRFTVNELGLIADHLRAPPGWPFYPWGLCEIMGKALRDAGHEPVIGRYR